MKVHYFYPQNDLALADGGPRYVAPAGARAIAEAGEALPLWYGRPGDVALCYGVNAAWFDKIMETFHLGTDLCPLEYEPGMQAAPWGWSAASRQKFADMGFPADALPCNDRLAQLRGLSHRRASVMLATALGRMLPSLQIVPAEEYTDASALCKRLRADGGVIKTPWSTSGRGVAFAGPGFDTDKACRLAEASIAKQGSALYEPAYNRACDFAMLYRCEDGKCRFCGTSVFTADAHGHYTGNLMAEEGERFSRIAALTPAEDLARVRDALQKIIEEEIATVYSGPLGIDMLVTGTGRLVPVVELNLRMTMGHVANILAARLLPEGAVGAYRVMPIRKREAYPLSDFTSADGKVTGGTLQLVPPNPNFRFEVAVGV